MGSGKASEELHCLYRSPNIGRVIKSRTLRCADHLARIEEGWSAFKILTGIPAGKRPLRRSRRKWEDNIRIGLKEIGIYTRNWIYSALEIDYWRDPVNAHRTTGFHS